MFTHVNVKTEESAAAVWAQRDCVAEAPVVGQEAGGAFDPSASWLCRTALTAELSTW